MSKDEKKAVKKDEVPKAVAKVVEKTEEVEKVPEPVVEAPKVEVPVTPPKEDAWDVETWRKVVTPRLGYRTFVLDGALYGQDLGRDYSEREIRELIEKFLSEKL